MVRQAFLKDLNDAINKSQHFEEHDFQISWKPADIGYDLLLAYRYDDNYYLSAHVDGAIENEQRDVAIFGIAQPGDIGVTENFRVYGRTRFVAYIRQWLMRLRAELEALPINRLVEEQRQRIEDLIGQLDDLPNEYFSRTEAQELKDRLDRLEEQMVSSVIANAAKDEDVSKRVTALENDFAALKENVEILKKPGWARAFATRVTKWMYDAENRKLVSDGVEITRKLLGP